MARLAESLRRNPDAVALAVLCLVMGVGRCSAPARGLLLQDTARERICWLIERPSAVAGAIKELVSDAPALPSIDEMLELPALPQLGF